MEEAAQRMARLRDADPQAWAEYLDEGACWEEGTVERLDAFAMPEYVRSIAQRRLQRHMGAATASTVSTVDDWLRRITAL